MKCKIVVTPPRCHPAKFLCIPLEKSVKVSQKFVRDPVTSLLVGISSVNNKVTHKYAVSKLASGSRINFREEPDFF